MTHGGRVAVLREHIVRQLDLLRSVKSATHIHLCHNDMRLDYAYFSSDEQVTF